MRGIKTRKSSLQSFPWEQEHWCGDNTSRSIWSQMRTNRKWEELVWTLNLETGVLPGVCCWYLLWIGQENRVMVLSSHATAIWMDLFVDQQHVSVLICIDRGEEWSPGSKWGWVTWGWGSILFTPRLWVPVSDAHSFLRAPTLPCDRCPEQKWRPAALLHE